MGAPTDRSSGCGAAGVPTLALGTNVGHGSGLDLGWVRARTQTVVALDVDAFPISDRWLSRLTTPLDEGRANVVGAHGGEVIDRLSADVDDEWRGRDFVHPCCLAMRLRRYAAGNHSFRADRSSGRDPGEIVSDRERPRLSFLEPTSHIGPGPVGTVFGDVVYHNFYAIRHRRQGSGTVDGVTAVEAAEAWRVAVARYLGCERDLRGRAAP